MSATKLDFIELEAMRKDDSSWRPCCISLSSCDSNAGIIVDFGNGDEDLLCSKEDAFSRLRFRSTPLQGDECTNIKEGDCVLALQKTQSKSLFIDATIEETKRVKHSKRVHCRCSFEVKWLNSELKGQIVTVPSKSILRSSDRSIDEHPIFSRFLKALSSVNGGESPSILSCTEESSCEAEFVGILEKQVEEISKLVDGPITSFANLFIDAKSTDIIRQKPSTAFLQSKSPQIRQNSSKRTTRRLSSNQIETEVTKETELKPVLSPLAARAALASLVHELPEKLLYFSADEDFLKLKDSQQNDATGVTELSALEATSNCVKSTCNHQIRVLLPTNPSKIKNDHTSLDVSNQLTTSSNRRIAGMVNTHGSSNMSANQEKEMEASRDYKPIIPQKLKNSENGERTKIPITMRITRSQQIKKAAEAKFPVAEAANSKDSVIDKVSISNSPSFQLEELSSDDDVVKEGSLLKKSAGSTIGTGLQKSTKRRMKSSSNTGMPTDTENKAEDLGIYEIRNKKFISTHVDSASETDSTAERNETAAKRRRLPREYDPGSDTKGEENHRTSKNNHFYLKKALKTTQMRSSPRLACPPRTRSLTNI